VKSRMRMTTPRAASSSAPSTPSKTSEASAAWPPKPARCTSTPSIWASPRSSSAAAGILAHPSLPKLKVK
jgi:hypothetical protein